MKSMLPRPRNGTLLAAMLIGGSLLLGTATAFAKAAPANNKNKTPAPAPVVATTYSGRAVALDIQGVKRPVEGAIVLADTGDLPHAGGSLEASHSNYLLMGDDGVTVALGVEFAHATTVGGGSAAASDSSLTGFQVTFASLEGELVTITADHISASARASVAANGRATADASSSFSNLLIDGVPFVVTGEPNQTLEIKGMRIVFNEETTVVTDGQADIKLVAMHFYVCPCMNGAFGVVYAGITAGTNPPPEESDCGKVTGGGWIVTPSSAKGTFAVSGGIRRGEFWGSLNFNDHGAGLKVKSTRVTGFSEVPGDPNSYVITYEVEINGGMTATATVVVSDRGEPGHNDDFSIRLSTGYSAGGSLGGDGSGGGNIQAHKCPPGWSK
jgi:hypothetical protein